MGVNALLFKLYIISCTIQGSQTWVTVEKSIIMFYTYKKLQGSQTGLGGKKIAI